MKPYVRIAATLSTVKPENSDAIPPFNPFDLYAEKKRGLDGKPTLQGAPADKPASNQFVTSRLLELAGGFSAGGGQAGPGRRRSERMSPRRCSLCERAAQLRPAIMPEEELGSGKRMVNSRPMRKNGRASAHHVLEKIADEMRATTK